MMPLSIVVLSFLLVGVYSARQKCTCDGQEYTYDISIFDNDDIKNLKFTQLQFPPGGQYGEQFRQTMQALVGRLVEIRMQMQNRKVNQQYITVIQGYQREIVQLINGFGSMSNGENFRRTMTDYSNSLMQLIVKINNYVKTVQDQNVRTYFYSVIFQLLSTRSFVDSSLDSEACIYRSRTVAQ